MPQSIYQGLTYIGETIQGYTPPWQKVPVWNWVEGNWVQLNADIGKVDYALRNLSFDRVMLDIFDHRNFDYLDYTLTVTGPGLPGTPVVLADNTDTTWITGLTANSTYTVNLVANLLSGGTTLDSIQTFKTPANPAPLAVTNLSSPARTNSWIDLAWTNPSGSTAVRYRVYYGREGQGATSIIEVAPGVFNARVVGLQEDVRYWYIVRGVNSTGLEGPSSNQLRWATGHNEIRRQGSDSSIVWEPREWGSYRPDIQWRWARESGILPKNPHLYQGYWPGNNWHGASNPAQNIEAGNTRRYWGVVRYLNSEIKEQLNAKHGAGVGDSITISKMAFRALYRHTNPGNIAAQDMVWHMTNSNPFNSGQPPVYEKFDGKAMRAGEKIEYYGLRAGWGTKLIRGYDDGTAVNGLVLHRKDNETNGYGAAGYGRWSGHLLNDPDTSGSWRKSNLKLMMEGSWDVVVRAYVGPSQW
jgi:hypothetical protein